MTVLIVDDEERIRLLIKEYCLNEKYTVLEASDGIQALDVIKENKVDIVILDIMMPNMDGLSTYQEIKNTIFLPLFYQLELKNTTS